MLRYKVEFIEVSMTQDWHFRGSKHRIIVRCTINFTLNNGGKGSAHGSASAWDQEVAVRMAKNNAWRDLKYVVMPKLREKYGN